VRCGPGRRQRERVEGVAWLRAPEHADHLVPECSVVDQLDPIVAADGKREQHPWEEHGVVDRQERQHVGDRDLVFGWIGD
jgi:hypothetical protein